MRLCLRARPIGPAKWPAVAIRCLASPAGVIANFATGVGIAFAVYSGGTEDASRPRQGPLCERRGDAGIFLLSASLRVTAAM